jgi:hypothetical protein
MGLCKKCIKRRRCIERDRWRCREYQNVEAVKAEVRSVTASGAAISETGSKEAVGAVETGDVGSRRLLLCTETEAADEMA